MMQQAKGQTVAYIRVSTLDQNPVRQFEAVGEVDRVFEDRISGGSRDGRTALQEMLGYIRADDLVRVASMDRLARSLIDLKAIVGEIVAKGAAVQFVKERLTFEPGAEDKFAVFQLHVLGAVAELERSLIKERQADGIKAAKARGVYKGRGRALKPAQLTEARQLIADDLPKAEVARRLGVDRSTLYRALSRAEREPL
ncbi:recombinase family protein [Sinomonas sp. ASV486]|uniref:recombinase family protein n=1 Tax=Sinomonas sp. ASV486 TaxID=3051170 RepID=UPI0027DDD541|nr:recombinase family protein [Sinomonas sp. ASV486]MDQ4490719.1 recombinase family protein [Sinomonas sp. ASV486]